MGNLPISAVELAISMPLQEPSETVAQPPSWFHTCWRMLFHVHVGILLVVYASLIGLLQIKFQSKKESPFETHRLFMIISVVSIVIFAASYWILDYRTKNSNMNPLSASSPSVFYKILVSVAFFSIILATLSVVLVLLLPPNLMWIGYLATGLLVIAIIAYNTSIDSITSLGKFSKLVNYVRDMF